MGNRLFGMAMTIGIAILAMAFSADSAWAERRIALAIGNSNYESVPKLPNPSRDAISMGQMFRDAGFDSVEVIINAGNQELKRALRKFASNADQADVAIIYYAGHGLEIGGINYLIPIDAKLASDVDAEDEAVRLDRVISSADGASKLRVIILDACRDNPFPSLMRRNKANGRAVSSGLGKAEPSSTDTLIAYAAKAGSTADDGDGQHSPFTTAILRNLTIPGLDIRLAFGRVRDEVMRVTGSRQEPFVYGSLGGSNFPLVPAPKAEESSEAEIRGDYELVAKVGTLRAWEVFLNTHKTGFYADLARAQVAALTDQEQTMGSTVTRSKGGGTVDGPKSGNVLVAAVPPPPAGGGHDLSSQEALEWSKIKDSTDPAVFENFIQKFPNAPLAINAQKKLEVLRQAEREREAAQKAAEEARIQAEQKKAAEAAAKKREEDERRAKALEAEQKAKAAEAERKAAEERQKAEQAARERAAAEAAAARAAAEKQAKEVEEARKKAERDAKEAACKTEQGKLEQILARGSAGTGIDDLKSFAASSTCERLSAQIAAANDKFRAEQARREREAAQKAAEEARIQAEQKKAEAAAAKKREDDARRAQEAEAADKAKAAAAELAAAKQREEDARRAKALEAEQQVKAAEAKRKAEQAEQERAAAEAAAARATAEKQAKEDERRAKAAEAEQKTKAAEAERLAAEEKRKAEQAAKEAVCNIELAKLQEIVAKGSDGSGLEDLNAFAKSITCDKLDAQVVAVRDKFKTETAARAATMPNSPQLVLAAQVELVRLGCNLPGKPNGVLNDGTRSAVERFLTMKGGKPAEQLAVTVALVEDLKKRTDRVCPLECKANTVAKGNECVAVEPTAPAATSRRKDEENVRKRQQADKREVEREQRRPSPSIEQRVRQQAIARPMVSGGGGGGGGGGGSTMIGVGF